MSFLGLPNELLFMIMRYSSIQDLKHLLEIFPYMTFVIPLLEAALQESFYTQPLCWAARNNYLGLAKILLLNGADVDRIDTFGKCPSRCPYGPREQAPLQYAAQYGSLAVAQLLIQHGADIEFRCGYGATALHHAMTPVYSGGCDPAYMVNILLEAGADINAKDHWEQTALHWAAEHNSDGIYEAMKLLLDRGINVNAKDASGKSALHFATDDERAGGEQGIINLLLDRGANIRLRDFRGKVAFKGVEFNKRFRAFTQVAEKS